MTKKWQSLLVFLNLWLIYSFIYLYPQLGKSLLSFSPTSSEMTNNPSLLPSHIPPWRLYPAYNSRRDGFHVMWLCSTSLSISNSRVNMWSKLGWSDFLLGIWNRDKEAESFCLWGAKLQGHAQLACYSMPDLHDPQSQRKLRTMSQQGLQRKRYKDVSDKSQTQTGK